MTGVSQSDGPDRKRNSEAEILYFSQDPSLKSPLSVFTETGAIGTALAQDHGRCVEGGATAKASCNGGGG